MTRPSDRWIRLRAVWLLAILFFWFARPTPMLLAAGALVALVGLAVRAWAAGFIQKDTELATDGPYAFTRNPLYLGSILLGAGFAVASASPWVALAVLVYFAAFYPAAMRGEAAFLADRFGAEYGAWAQSVPLLLPRPLPAGPRATRFEWARVARNREWRTALAVPALLLLLWVRSRIA